MVEEEGCAERTARIGNHIRHGEELLCFRFGSSVDGIFAFLDQGIGPYEPRLRARLPQMASGILNSLPGGDLALRASFRLNV